MQQKVQVWHVSSLKTGQSPHLRNLIRVDGHSINLGSNVSSGVKLRLIKNAHANLYLLMLDTCLIMFMN